MRVRLRGPFYGPIWGPFQIPSSVSKKEENNNFLLYLATRKLGGFIEATISRSLIQVLVDKQRIFERKILE